ncbi:MAG: sulfurtransferase TusA family protein [Alphaproteobacteria bacterium]|nr:sulfurtransferase TusA family protein [Alphaproteobacteria bacterium]
MANRVVLDARGLKCPLPVLRAGRAMRSLASGDVLEVQATDPSTVPDFDAFCRTTGHHLESRTEAEGVFVFAIRKA